MPDSVDVVHVNLTDGDVGAVDDPIPVEKQDITKAEIRNGRLVVVHFGIEVGAREKVIWVECCVDWNTV